MLLICFIIQFVIAIVCLALISNSSRYDLLQTGWANLDNETRRHTEFKYNCCGFDNSDYLKFKLKTEYMSECPSTAEEPCFHALESSISKALKATGICALIFSFTNVTYQHFPFLEYIIDQLRINHLIFIFSSLEFGWLCDSEINVTRNVIRTSFFDIQM